jgi:serine/threonine-protein kinase
VATSVLIERTGGGDDELRSTAVSDVPVDATFQADVPQPGTVLDERYEITGLLGQGGMGHVLAARHVVLGQRLAIKVLRREMTRDAEIVERFRREARAASAIGHAGIVQVKDFGSLASGASYYVMEHVDGVGLADVIADEGALPIERAIDVVRQMADALGAAHAAGIIHRDVKPENVILTSFAGRPDHVKLLDFGIAKLDFASRLSGAHRVLGTPHYMSPEQAKGQKLDQRCDVYALGIVLFELLTGAVPFDDRQPLEVLRQQIHSVPPSVKVLRPEVPDGVADAIARCLEKSPEARPADMLALADLLAPFGPQRGGLFASSSVPTPAPVRASSASAMGYAATSLALPAPAPPGVPVAFARRTPSVPSVEPQAPRPAARTPISAVLVAGITLTVVGVAALAAAGGLFLRGRADDRAAPIATSPPVVAPPPSMAAAPIASPPIVAPAPIASTPVATVPVAPPPTASPHVASTWPHPHAHAAPPPSTTVAPPPATEPAVDPHPTIRVIDPWDDP